MWYKQISVKRTGKSLSTYFILIIFTKYIDKLKNRHEMKKRDMTQHRAHISVCCVQLSAHISINRILNNKLPSRHQLVVVGPGKWMMKAFHKKADWSLMANSFSFDQPDVPQKGYIVQPEYIRKWIIQRLVHSRDQHSRFNLKKNSLSIWLRVILNAHSRATY